MMWALVLFALFTEYEVMDGNEKLYDFLQRSEDAGLRCKEPTKTVQADLEDADINTIVRRFGLTGEMPQNLAPPSYVDYDGVFDYHSAQMAILQAQSEFMSMPAAVRARFDNDPGVFLAFCETPGNEAEMRELGLLLPKVEGNVEVPATVVE